MSEVGVREAGAGFEGRAVWVWLSARALARAVVWAVWAVLFVTAGDRGHRVRQPVQNGRTHGHPPIRLCSQPLPGRHS
ncbi:hypothetical protein ACWDZ8_31820, partial [Streptomyces sp. NPDC003233]